MCFYMALSRTAQEIENRYHARFDDSRDFVPVFIGNGFGSINWPVITGAEPDRIQMFGWGLIPRWARSKDEADKIRQKTINARSETIFEKPSFRQAAANRCLIPLTGFYEWHEYSGKKYPFFIQMKDQEVFSLGGIWETWTDRNEGGKIHTFSVVTTEANPLLAKIHNTRKRMPVIVDPRGEKEWLASDLSPERQVSMMKPCPDSWLAAYPVDRRIASRTAAIDGPEAQMPVDYPGIDLQF